ncbi:MAG: ABC transporter permease [Azospirillaceae bacterium]
MIASLDWLRRQPWIWSFVGAIAVWAVTVALVEGRGAGATVTAALTFSVFYVIVGIGQMFVVTTGPGNVDLSIPANIALSGAVAMKVMNGQDSLIVVGLVAALGTGFCVGLFNVALIRVLMIPPIIATLSASFIVQSTAIAYGRGLRVKPPAALSDFMEWRLPGGIPVIALLTIAFAAAMVVVLERTAYGRSVLAIGQSDRVARLAGVPVARTRFVTYTLCATLAGLSGALLAAFSGGASLDMGQPFLLASIAVVVIGGTSIAGGKANVPGVWGAALFLFLLVTMLNTMGVSSGMRQMLTGVIIIAIIALAGGEKTR